MMEYAPRDFLYNKKGQLIESYGTEYEYIKGNLSCVSHEGESIYFEYGDDTLLDSVSMPNGDSIRYDYNEMNTQKNIKMEYVLKNTHGIIHYN